MVSPICCWEGWDKNCANSFQMGKSSWRRYCSCSTKMVTILVLVTSTFPAPVMLQSKLTLSVQHHQRLFGHLGVRVVLQRLIAAPDHERSTLWRELQHSFQVAPSPVSPSLPTHS